MNGLTLRYEGCAFRCWTGACFSLRDMQGGKRRCVERGKNRYGFSCLFVE